MRRSEALVVLDSSLESDDVESLLDLRNGGALLGKDWNAALSKSVSKGSAKSFAFLLPLAEVHATGCVAFAEAVKKCEYGMLTDLFAWVTDEKRSEALQVVIHSAMDKDDLRALEIGLSFASDVPLGTVCLSNAMASSKVDFAIRLMDFCDVEKSFDMLALTEEKKSFWRSFSDRKNLMSKLEDEPSTQRKSL